MALKSKAKKPETVTNSAVAEYYQKYGNEFVAEGKQTIGYRYDQVEGRKLRKPDGTEFTNNVTLSQPAAEVLTLLKDGSDWYLVLGRQIRSPYVVEVNGKLYSRIFLEQAGGLVEEGQSYLQAAVAEAKQELGAKLIYLTELVKPRLFKHTSYTDETSKLYLAVTEKLQEQELDREENISVSIILR